MKKRVVVAVFVLALLFSPTAGVQRVKASSQTEYPLASGLDITSPSNTTYISSLLTLNVSITTIDASNIRISMTYSLDGMFNNTIPLITHSRENSFQATKTGSVILPTLSYGSHNVTVFAEHTINNELAHLDKNTVHFTIRSNSEQEIPEFPSWIILPFFIVATLVVMIVKNNIRKKGLE